jgi:transposase
VSGVIIIGLDIAKHVFHAHGADERGRAVFRKRISRGKLLDFFAAQPSCTVALEACGGAHHWARQLTQLGHEVRLIPPAYVRPFVKRQKNDANDAEAICEAAQRPSMRFVAVKSEQQQAAGLVFRTRDLLVRQEPSSSTRSGATSLNTVGSHPRDRRMWRCSPTCSRKKRWPAHFPKRPAPCSD